MPVRAFTVRKLADCRAKAARAFAMALPHRPASHRQSEARRCTEAVAA